ncbi:MAG: SusE domain-containing protein [Chitinophagaceae bacterium]
MKKINKFLVMLTAAIALFASCTKVEDLPVYSTGGDVTLSANKTAVTTAPADSNNVALTLNWSDPKFSTVATNQKFVVQIDSAGRNFTKAVSRTVNAVLTTGFTGKEFNNILLGFGFAFNVSYSVEIRVIASYGNNNDQKISNVLRISATPYKVPPKIALPTSNKLFIVGGGTEFDWTNSATVNPAEEFTRTTETMWQGIFRLTGGGEYLILPVKGSWANKFSIANKFLAGVSAGGDFGFNLNDNFVAPAATGMYLITLEFQTGKFTCVPYTGPTLPNNLFIVGGATPGSWSNPVPVPSQQFTRLNSCEFEIASLNLNQANGMYLFLPVNGSWSEKYGGVGSSNGSNDPLSDSFKAGGSDLRAPSVAGNYKINVNFATTKFNLTKL